MNDLQLIKLQIYKDDRVEELLELLECEYITFKSNRYEAQLPFEKFHSSNKRGVQVKMSETLPSYVRNRGFSGDIFGLVSFIKFDCKNQEEAQANLFDAKEWVVDNMELHHLVDRGGHHPHEDYLHWLKDLKKRRKKDKVIDLSQVIPNDVLNEEIKEQYIMLPHEEWVREGISIDTQREFEVGFDLLTKRIVVMMRNKKGELVGVKGRTTIPNHEEKDIPKYLFLYKYNKSIEWYNLNRSLPYIQEEKKVLIFEGYKSCMKAHQFGYMFNVSIEGDNITDVQSQIIKELGRDVEVILCYDKDKYCSVDEETGEIEYTSKEVKDVAKAFRGMRVSCVLDTESLIGIKDSPVDKGLDVWEKLYENRFTIYEK